MCMFILLLLEYVIFLGLGPQSYHYNSNKSTNVAL